MTMIEQDTVKLLRECDAGVNMGISSLDEVMDYVSAPGLRHCLSECRREHDVLAREVQDQLLQFHESGRQPNPVAKTMSGLMTDVKLKLHESDQTIADLMTDGCNMGVKSLNRYLNEYKAADERSKDIAKRLIHLEESLTKDLQSYL